MKEKIVLFTANVQGGILQLTLQIYKTLLEEGYVARVFMPQEITNIDIGAIDRGDLFQYHKEKKVLDKTPYKNLAKQINEVRPDYVWYMDDSVICSNVGLYLDKGIKQLLTLHDAGTHHPTNHKSVRAILVEKYTKAVNTSFYRNVYKFVLMSPESMKTFFSLYPAYKEKAEMMTLGAHLPEVEEIKPSEMRVDKNYFLFFGRIDKYKGIGNLLRAYRNVSSNVLPLVIAGGGRFTDEENRLIEGCNNLTVINRYIDDGEMKWLLHHMSVAVLPYIEATQSGVIPLAYLFSKPVMVSNVAGLTQFVINGKTGFVCNTQSEWEDMLVHMSDSINGLNDKVIRKYYEDKMDWNKNIKEFFSKI